MEPVANEGLVEALGIWGRRKDQQVFAAVMTRALEGELLLDVTDSRIADPSAGFQPGDTIAIASQRDNAGKQVLLAFTSNDELARYRGHPGRSLVEPAAAVIARAMRDYEGIVIDGRSENFFIGYSDEMRRCVTDDPEGVARITDAGWKKSMPFPHYLQELARTPLFIPFEVQRDEQGRETGVVVPTARDAQGNPCAVAATAPAEIWLWSAGSGAQQTALANIARSVLEHGQTGVVLNPAGRFVFIAADDLRQFATA